MVPIYLVVVFLLHVDLGYLATGGAVVVIVIAILNEWLTTQGSQRAAAMEMAETRFSDESLRIADSIVAMGMTGGASAHWRSLRNGALRTSQRPRNAPKC